jgi:hypothetical protein
MMSLLNSRAFHSNKKEVFKFSMFNFIPLFYKLLQILLYRFYCYNQRICYTISVIIIKM